MAPQAHYHSAPMEDLENVELLSDELPAARPRSSPKRSLAAALGLLGFGAAAAALVGRSSSPASLITGSIGAVTGLSEDPCSGEPFLDMKEILHNNLGGKGPDKGAEGIVFKGKDLGSGESGKEILMVVNATGDYSPDSAKSNGFNGKYMTVNVQGGTKVHIHIRMLDAATKEPVKLHEQDFTFFDLDTATGGKNTEYLKTTGFDEVVTTQNTEVKISKGDDGFTTFKASTRGTGADNPRDPLLLTLQQRDRAVMLKFKDADNIEAELGCSEGPHPRYFTFVGRPSLACGKIKGGGDSTLVTKDSEGNETKLASEAETTTAAPTEAAGKKCLFTIPIINFCVPNPFA
mmetsp:Transcript_56923/g.128418  ORF Transcript_56923/g.128418 Transcript_56923/m.128418 type:complete len:347 (+) Transcript_56923:80-1120(+)